MESMVLIVLMITVVVLGMLSALLFAALLLMSYKRTQVEKQRAFLVDVMKHPWKKADIFMIADEADVAQEDDPARMLARAKCYYEELVRRVALHLDLPPGVQGYLDQNGHLILGLVKGPCASIHLHEYQEVIEAVITHQNS